jgi:hypothetical protein
VQIDDQLRFLAVDHCFLWSFAVFRGRFMVSGDLWFLGVGPRYGRSEPEEIHRRTTTSGELVAGKKTWRGPLVNR